MKKLLLVIAVLTMSASAASATILWDQAAVDPAQDGYPDAYSIGPWGDVIVYGASDFTLPVSSTITSITTFYTATGQWVDGDYPVLVDVYAKTDITPITGTDDPLATGISTTGTLTTVGDGTMSLTVSGLSIALAPGDYWIMASPTIADGPSFREFHMAAAAPWGDSSCVIEFGGWFAPAWQASGQDGAMIIEGDVVVATESASFGGVKSLYR